MKFEEAKEDFYSEVVATSTLPSDGVGPKRDAPVFS